MTKCSHHTETAQQHWEGKEGMAQLLWSQKIGIRNILPWWFIPCSSEGSWLLAVIAKQNITDRKHLKCSDVRNSSCASLTLHLMLRVKGQPGT